MIDNNYQDTKTPEMVERLQAFWAAQDILGTTWAPSFGQYPADLILSADQDPAPINPSLASQPESVHHWHTAKPIRYDDSTYQAQGVEPPQNASDDVWEQFTFYRGVINVCGAMVGGAVLLWAILAYGLPMLVGGLLRWLGA